MDILLLCLCCAVNWRAEGVSVSLGYTDGGTKERPFTFLLAAGPIKSKSLTYPSGCTLPLHRMLSAQFSWIRKNTQAINAQRQ